MIFALLLLVQEAEDAESVLRRLEEAVSACRTLRVESRAKVEGNEPIDAECRLLLGEGGRLSFRMKGGGRKRGGEITAISDGQGFCGTDLLSGLAPEESGSNLRIVVGRLGVYVLDDLRCFWPIGRMCHGDTGKKIVLSDFATLPREGDIAVIEYRVRLREVREVEGPIAVKLWMDAKSGMPVKRELTIASSLSKRIITETYAVFERDPKLDPESFRLPE